MFRDLADDAAGKPGQVVRGASRVAVTGQLLCLLFEVMLAVAGGGQRRPGRGSSQVGELADGTGEDPQQGGVVLAEGCQVLARAVHGRDIRQGPGDGAGPRSQLLQRASTAPSGRGTACSALARGFHRRLSRARWAAARACAAATVPHSYTARILDWGWVACTLANMMNEVMAGLPAAAQDRLPASGLIALLIGVILVARSPVLAAAPMPPTPRV